MKIDNIKVLIVDDDEDDFFLTADYIRDIPNKGFEIKWANSYNEGLAQLTQNTFDICFFDFLLGAKTGIDLLKIAIEQKIDSPVILLTGKGDKKVDIEAMELGAMDYLIKSELDTEKIERCIRYSLERAESTRRLRESETQLRGIFEEMQDAILLKRTNHAIFFYNDAALNLLGYDKIEIKGITLKNLILEPEEFERYSRILGSYGHLKNFETWIVRKNGEKIQCSLNISKHVDSTRKDYFLIVIQDITARKKSERDRILTEKSASTARFIRTLAHEVRNPLSNIHLSLDQLEPELEDEELKMFTDVIRRNSHRINALITDLLNSFKTQETSLCSISIHEVLDEVLADADDSIKLKKIKLIKNYGEECFLNLDKSKIKIALFNFVVNAVEAMEAEKGILTINTSVKNDHCFVEIIDNGSGISSENINRLFEPYFTSKSNGLGLGLAATLTILQSHNASVQVSSEVGKGSVFTISFAI